jgi:hypothetical protein
MSHISRDQADSERDLPYFWTHYKLRSWYIFVPDICVNRLGAVLAVAEKLTDVIEASDPSLKA